jgi:hypothetical protein
MRLPTHGSRPAKSRMVFIDAFKEVSTVCGRGWVCRVRVIHPFAIANGTDKPFRTLLNGDPSFAFGKRGRSGKGRPNLVANHSIGGRAEVPHPSAACLGSRDCNEVYAASHPADRFHHEAVARRSTPVRARTPRGCQRAVEQTKMGR